MQILIFPRTILQNSPKYLIHSSLSWPAIPSSLFPHVKISSIYYFVTFNLNHWSFNIFLFWFSLILCPVRVLSVFFRQLVNLVNFDHSWLNFRGWHFGRLLVNKLWLGPLKSVETPIYAIRPSEPIFRPLLVSFISKTLQFMFLNSFSLLDLKIHVLAHYGFNTKFCTSLLIAI